MPNKTKSLFELLFDDKNLREAVLIGGTALSIQIGHRLSEDLDFAFFADTLPVQNINNLLSKLSEQGLTANLLIPQGQISQARINGFNLLDYVQDYNINGVRVSFFTFDKGGKARKEYFKNVPKKDIGAAFKIFGINEVFESKCVVLRDRAKSRDLYDLMYLLQNHNYDIKDIFNNIEKIDAPLEGANPIKEVLIGNVPIDANDPGLSIIKGSVNIEDIHQYFSKEVNQYEQEQARLLKKAKSKLRP